MVRTLKYKGKELPIRLSYRVFKGMRVDLKGTNVGSMEDMDPELMESMLWHGLVSGHAAESKVLELTKENMEDVLDECMFEFLEMIPEFFPEAKVGNVLKNLPKEQQQKILTKKESAT